MTAFATKPSPDRSASRLIALAVRLGLRLQVEQLAVPLLAILLLVSVRSAWAIDPTVDCAAQPGAVIVTEIALGDAKAPRWIELYNPGKQPVSLLSWSVQVEPKAPWEAGLYPLPAGLGELAPGALVVIGTVPEEAPPIKMGKLWEMPANFELPCAAKLVLTGPKGEVDAVSWDVCKTPGPQVWALDPGQLSTCKNDDFLMWCPAPPGPTGPASPGVVNAACDLDGDGFGAVTAAGTPLDCDDLNKQVFPGAAELCNGVDDNCNGQPDDGVTPPVGMCLTQGVCAWPSGKSSALCTGVGGFVCAYPYGYEAVTETLCDGFDNDCDGITDEGLTNTCGTCGPLPLEVCNNIDDDCDGLTDDAVDLAISCTQTGVCAQSKPVCLAGKPTCSVPIAWQATETACDALDNDCDGLTDEEMGVGSECVKGLGSCARPGVVQCGPDGLAHCSAVVGDPSEELCGDGLDNDCDGGTDEDFDVAAQCSAGTGACRVTGKKVCAADRHSAVCNVVALAPAGGEVCSNDVDDDCDGQTDEAGCTTDGHAQAGCQAGPMGAPYAGGVGYLSVALACALIWWRRRSVQHDPQPFDMLQSEPGLRGTVQGESAVAQRACGL